MEDNELKFVSENLKSKINYKGKEYTYKLTFENIFNNKKKRKDKKYYYNCKSKLDRRIIKFKRIK